MKTFLKNVKFTPKALLIYIFTLLLATTFAAQTKNIPAGSVIIDMGIVPQTINNGLRPYGLVYSLIKEDNTPVVWSINPLKNKDGIDFTVDGLDFKGGPFIIEKGYLTNAVLSKIATWKASGVVTYTTLSSTTVPLHKELTYFANWVLDTDNGSFAATYISNAGIPTSSYKSALPNALTACDDLFILPHADPTWANHGASLLAWNAPKASGGNAGWIWSGCHAVSALEDLFNPANPSQQTNFLATKTSGTTVFKTHYYDNALIPWGHANASGANLPYPTAFPANPFMQYMGSTDGAHNGGSERIYIPVIGGGWRPTTNIAVWDPGHTNAGVAPRQAAMITFGPGFGDVNRGMVMYEGGHDLTKQGTVAERVAAQRAFLNFSFEAPGGKAPVITDNSSPAIPAVIEGGTTLSFNVGAITYGNSAKTYAWTSSCAGTFSDPSIANPTFTTSPVTSLSNCVISVTVTDACGRKSFKSWTLSLMPPDPNSGYIYVHKKAISEVASLDFNFSLKNSGGTTISSFILNDQPDVDGNAYDMGNSHGAGEGQLWTILSSNISGSVHDVAGTLYTRPRESSQWQRISTITNAISVDGIGLNSAVYADFSGNVFIYNAGVSARIWNPSSHSNVKIVDVASAGPGLGIAVIGDNGSIYKYTGSGTTDSWTRFANVNATAGFKPFRLDMRPSTEEIFFISTGTDGNVYKIASANPATATIVTAAPAPSSPSSPDYLRDVAVSNNGVIFTNYETSLYENFIFEYRGGAWTHSRTSRGLHGLTAGVDDQAWGINKVNNDVIDHSIFTRLSSGEWLDDERVRVAHKGNSIMIPLPAGTYKLSEVVPTDWFNNDIEIFDPTSNSTFDLVNSEASINVAAGEVVHVVYSNSLKNSVNIPQVCTKNYVVDFGTGDTVYGPPQQGFTSYHYSANGAVSDGYYTIVKDNQNWFYASPSSVLISHTETDPPGKGYYAIFNAAYEKSDFFRQTVTNLVVGTEYEFAFWVADVSPLSPIRPNVTMGILNPASGLILGSVNTGNISNTSWVRYNFNFVATENTLQIFLKNNSIGGDGNDIAIDDISFTPLPPAIPIPQLQGQVVPYQVCSNKGPNTEVFQFTNSLPGGVWSSSDPTKLTINATSGLAVPVANENGVVQVTYSYTHATGCISEASINVTLSANCACYNNPATTTAGVATKHGITLLQRAGSDNGNWPMIRTSAHTVLESNTKGFVITRMTPTQISGLTGQEGMMVYDTVNKCLKIYSDGAWSCFTTPTCP